MEKEEVAVAEAEELQLELEEEGQEGKLNLIFKNIYTLS